MKTQWNQHEAPWTLNHPLNSTQVYWNTAARRVCEHVWMAKRDDTGK